MTCIYNELDTATDECAECGAGLCSTCGFIGQPSGLHFCIECYETLMEVRNFLGI